MTINDTASQKSVHPFPARMAPEIAIEECRALRSGSLVVDPMVGSGTSAYAAVHAGCEAIGFDLDPLAILMARVRTTSLDIDNFLSVSKKIVAAASASRRRRIPHIDDDLATSDFVDFWFAPAQQAALRPLMIQIMEMGSAATRDALLVAFSKLIITKDKGASLGRDVSHSRPHRVRVENLFDVFREFDVSCNRLARVVAGLRLIGTSHLMLGDARQLGLTSSCADLIVTSPPYLNAIDYLRGHRLSLVWMGYGIAELRNIRAVSVGAERTVSSVGIALDDLRSAIGTLDDLDRRSAGIVDRYLIDLDLLYREQARVLKPHRRAVTVIGNCAVRGTFLRNDDAAVAAARRNGLRLVERYERELPANRRYLPPPQKEGAVGVTRRMRTETILKFVKE